MEAIARDRFLELERSLRFYDQRLERTNDPLFKIRSILDQIPKVSQRIYTPDQQLSVDESLVHSEGRFPFLQLIQRKAAKCGFKLFCVAESKTGYLLNWHFFTTSQVIEAPFTENIVLELLNFLED